jgi:hypothetical protein
MTGPQILKGAERDEIMRDAIIDRMTYWKDHYVSAECTGAEDVNGKPAFKLVMKPNTGPDQTLFFDKESKLLVKIQMTMENPMGKIPMEAFSEDYREVDGILIAHKGVVKVMGMETIMTTEEIKHNIEIPEGTFDIPAEIQALAKPEPAAGEPQAEETPQAEEKKPE